MTPPDPQQARSRVLTTLWNPVIFSPPGSEVCETGGHGEGHQRGRGGLRHDVAGMVLGPVACVAQTVLFGTWGPQILDRISPWQLRAVKK